MRRAAALLVAVCLLPVAAFGAEWGGIEPGITTGEQVRARYGPPTRETPLKVEGYDTVEWTYEGVQAPVGLLRMAVELGLLTPAGYRPQLVRVFRLEPKPLIFGRSTVLDGWGSPDRAGTENGHLVFVYESGLLVTFDEAGESATTMYFTVPQTGLAAQPQTPAPGSPPASPPAPGPAAPAAPAPAPAPAPVPTPPRR